MGPHGDSLAQGVLSRRSTQPEIRHNVATSAEDKQCGHFHPRLRPPEQGGTLPGGVHLCGHELARSVPFSAFHYLLTYWFCLQVSS